MSGRVLLRPLSIALVLLCTAGGCQSQGAAPAPAGMMAQQPATAPGATAAPVPTQPPPEPVVAASESASAQPGATPLIQASLAAEPQPTDAQVVSQLREEIWVNWIMPVVMSCLEQPQGQAWPALEWFQGQGLDGALCLWGFPEGEEVSVEIHEPGGGLVGTRVITETESFSDVSVISLPVNFAGLPAGEWRVAARSPSAHLDSAFTVAPAQMPVLSVISGVGRDVLTPTLPALANGEKSVIVGAGLPPGRTLPFGIYRGREKELTRERLALVTSSSVTTDATGQFTLPWAAQAADPPGDYYVIVQIAPGYEPDPTGLFLSDAGAIASFEIQAR